MDAVLNDTLIPGSEYVYKSHSNERFYGQIYIAHRVVTDVPSYQKKVLVEGRTGPDKGRWFTCTLNNFSIRFKPRGSIL